MSLSFIYKKKVVFHLTKKLKSSSIFKTIEVDFLFQKKLRLTSNFKNIEVVFHFQKKLYHIPSSWAQHGYSLRSSPQNLENS